MNPIKSLLLSTPLAFIATVLVATVLVATVHAGTVTVNVTDAEGKPAPNAVVTARALGKPLAAGAPVTNAQATMIAQEKLQFSPFVSIVQVGSSVKFINKDMFQHHVKSFSPAKSFELRMDAAKDKDKPHETGAPVVFDKPGIVALQCAFHGSMRGHIFVADTPYVATTDAKGNVLLTDVPDGEVELKVWHPDQFVDQNPVKAQSTSALTAATMKLNMTPRVRRGG